MTGTQPFARRGAFTLIELLVVIILIMILAGLAAAFLPAIGDSARAAQGATMLQQWILTARQKALRDQVPCGLRLIPYVDSTTGKAIIYTKPDPATGRIVQMPAQVRQCQFIERPDDFTVPPTSSNTTIAAQTGNVGYLITDPLNATSPPAGYPMKRVFIYSQYPDGTVLQINKLVAIGDYLEILGNGLMHKITGIGTPVRNPLLGTSELTTEIDLNSTVLMVDSLRRPVVGFPVANTKQWRIVRAPRVTGDDLLQLPDSVIIDLKSNDRNGNSLPIRTVPANQAVANFDPIDILFSPSGAVISSGFTNDSINLWVREYDSNPKTNPFPPPLQLDPNDADVGHSDQTIIAVYVRTGLTAAHPPAPGVDPYSFIKDGRTSGK